MHSHHSPQGSRHTEVPCPFPLSRSFAVTLIPSVKHMILCSTDQGLLVRASSSSCFVSFFLACHLARINAQW